MCKRSNSFSWLVLIERSSLSMLIALLSIRWDVHNSYNCWRLNNDNPSDIITQIRVYLDRFDSECSGGYREGETPGPIPNPEAKPLSVDGTARGTLWESRSPPDIIIKRSYSLTSVMGLAPFLFVFCFHSWSFSTNIFSRLAWKMLSEHPCRT